MDLTVWDHSLVGPYRLAWAVGALFEGGLESVRKRRWSDYHSKPTFAVAVFRSCADAADESALLLAIDLFARCPYIADTFRGSQHLSASTSSIAVTYRLDAL
jgi:hypothetical protein